jgi:cellulose synthase/poly-beta-1,6-N-acetylglucosamine synthase-like glycosyltransferase
VSAAAWIAFGSAALLGWIFAGFPLASWLRARLAPRPWRCARSDARVSLVICAYNEAASIGRTLENALAQGLASERLEILVASDGSTDRTESIARSFAGQGVRVLALPRRGKIPTLNAAIAEARGEILVFSDANSELAPGALAALLAPFADPEVGAVAGDQRYADKRSAGEDSEAERFYWGSDRVLKRWHAAAGSAISATGSLHALRRELCEVVPPGVTDDFFLSTCAIARGRRLVFAEDAVAVEAPASSTLAELRRKRRIMMRGLRAVWLRRALLDPRRTGFYAVQLFTHKVLRRLVALPVLAVAISAPLALPRSLGALVAAGELCALAIAALGWLRARDLAPLPRVFALAYFAVAAQLAGLAACLDLLRGRSVDRWEPARAAAPDSAARADTPVDPLRSSR